LNKLKGKEEEKMKKKKKSKKQKKKEEEEEEEELPNKLKRKRNDKEADDVFSTKYRLGSFPSCKKKTIDPMDWSLLQLLLL